jgi:alanyl-tRNA synthetase
LVAPDRLRFDFNHPEAVTPDQLAEIEAGVNHHIFGDFPLKITYKPLLQAISEGAMALFGEKYTETVRTITIGGDKPFSYELCGGTHVNETGDIGICLIVSEGSVAAGIRRIEAVTGRKAYELIQNRFTSLNQAAGLLDSTPEVLPVKVTSLLDELSSMRKQVAAIQQSQVSAEFNLKLQQTKIINGVHLLATILNEADADSLRQMTDRYRQQYPSKGIVVLGSVRNNRPIVITAITDDLIPHGMNAVELVKFVAKPLGGGGGGKPTLAQAGGKDATRLESALYGVEAWLKEHFIE